MPFYENDMDILNNKFVKIVDFESLQAEMGKGVTLSRADLQGMKTHAVENASLKRAHYFVHVALLPKIIKKAEKGETRYTLSKFVDGVPENYDWCISNTKRDGDEFICASDCQNVLKILKEKMPDVSIEIREQIRFSDGKTERMLVVDWS